MSTRMTRHQMTRQNTRVDLGVAYGLIAGAAIGSVLFAFTGVSLWISFGAGIGLILGLASAWVVAGHRADEPTDEQEAGGSRRPPVDREDVS